MTERFGFLAIWELCLKCLLLTQLLLNRGFVRFVYILRVRISVGDVLRNTFRFCGHSRI